LVVGNEKKGNTGWGKDTEVLRIRSRGESLSNSGMPMEKNRFQRGKRGEGVDVIRGEVDDKGQCVKKIFGV